MKNRFLSQKCPPPPFPLSRFTTEIYNVMQVACSHKGKHKLQAQCSGKRCAAIIFMDACNLLRGRQNKYAIRPINKFTRIRMTRKMK